IPINQALTLGFQGQLALCSAALIIIINCHMVGMLEPFSQSSQESKHLMTAVSHQSSCRPSGYQRGTSLSEANMYRRIREPPSAGEQQAASRHGRLGDPLDHGSESRGNCASVMTTTGSRSPNGFWKFTGGELECMCSKSFFFEIVHVKPAVHGAMARHVGADVVLHVFLGF